MAEPAIVPESPQNSVDWQPTAVGAGWHALLLRMAGLLPDDLISEARAWLAEGSRVDVAQAIAFAAAAGRVPLAGPDADLIYAELIAAEQDSAVVGDLRRINPEDGPVPSPWWFAPVRAPGTGDGEFVPLLLDLSSDLHGTRDADEVDRMAVAEIERDVAVTALWRAWRMPADRSPWPEPKRVFVVTVSSELNTDAESDALPALTGRLQDMLGRAGEVDPQVEVCPEDLAMGAYQATACARGALLWAREPAVPIRLARVFDAVDPQLGPRFDPDHPLIEDEDEVGRLLDYLDGAVPVLATSALMADILDPDRPAIVPLTFRTDGEWIWTDTVSYYLESYLLAPDAGLLAHLRAAQSPPEPVSDVALHRVLAFLQKPGEQEPVWVVPETADQSRSARV